MSSCPSSGSSTPGARSSTRRRSSIAMTEAGEWTTHVAWAQLGGGLLLPGGAWGGVGVGALDSAPLRDADQARRRAPVQPQLPQHGPRRARADHLRRRARHRHLRRRASSPPHGAAGSRRRHRHRGRVADRPRAGIRAGRLPPRHPKIAAAITTLANAVEDTERLLFHRGDWTAVLEALAYLGFDVIVLWTAFLADPRPPGTGLRRS